MNLAGMKNLSTFTRYQQPGDAEYLSVLNNRPTSFAGQPLARDKATP